MAANQLPTLSSSLLEAQVSGNLAARSTAEGERANFDNKYVAAQKTTNTAGVIFHEKPEEFCSDDCITKTGCVLYTICACYIVIPAAICGLLGECCANSDERHPIINQVISEQPKSQFNEPQIQKSHNSNVT